MEKKIIFFDIDGTLLTDDKTILDSTKKAIKKLQDQGHETAIATGRNAKMSKDIIDELNMKNYVVCNGAAGYFHNERAYFNPLNKEAFERFMKTADSNEHQIVYETAHELKRRSKQTDNRIENGMQSVGYEVPDYDRGFYKHHELTQALVFYNEEERHLYEDGQFPEFRFVRWYESGVDVLPENGSKYETIIRLSESKGFKKENIIAFGDGLNDYEMISNVGIGIAMGNAKNSIKQVAEKITDTNNNGGIHLALKELALI